MPPSGKWIALGGSNDEHILGAIDAATDSDFLTWSGALGRPQGTFHALAGDPESFQSVVDSARDWLWNPVASGFDLKRSVVHTLSETLVGIGNSVDYSYTVTGTLFNPLEEDPGNVAMFSRYFPLNGTSGSRASRYFDPSAASSSSGGAIPLASGTISTLRFDMPGNYEISVIDNNDYWRDNSVVVTVSGEDAPNFLDRWQHVGDWKLTNEGGNNYVATSASLMGEILSCSGTGVNLRKSDWLLDDSATIAYAGESAVSISSYVNTASIVDEAVTVFGSSFTAGTIAVPSGTFAEIQDVTITSAGNAITIWTSAGFQKTSGASNLVSLRITKDGNSLVEWEDNFPEDFRSQSHFTYQSVPTSGTVTFGLEAKGMDQVGTAAYRSLVVLEGKK